MWKARVIVAIGLVLITGGRAAGQQNTLWIGYRLPSNPDLQANARTVEAQARTERIGALAICENSPASYREKCERDAEVTFRGRLLGSPDITMGLYVQTSESENPWWLINLTADLGRDPDFDRNFYHLEPGRVYRVGLHVDLGNCRVLVDADNSDVEMNGKEVSYVCEMIEKRKTAAGMLSQLIEMKGDPPLDEVDWLLNHGADANDVIGSAVENGRVNIVRVLLDHHADPNRRQPGPGYSQYRTLDSPSTPGDPEAEKGSTLLKAAIAASEERPSAHDQYVLIAGLLLDQGASPNTLVRVRTNENLTSPNTLGPVLLIAAWDGDAALVKMLLEHHADVNMPDNSGGNALWWVATNYRPSTEVAQILIEHGADVNAKGANGNTALMQSSSRISSEIVRLLIENNADVNAQNDDGYTALMFAAGEELGHKSSRDRAATVTSLLEAKAQVNTRGKDGRTALKIAEENSASDIVTLLRQHGAVP